MACLQARRQLLIHQSAWYCTDATTITACLLLQVLDLHAEKVMYQTVLVADTTLAAPSAFNATPACYLDIAGSGLTAASAALSVLQAAATAGAASARLLLPQGGSSSGNEASGGLPGMLKSWAAETGAAVVADRQQAHDKVALVLTNGPNGQQPAFTEQESR
jgi:hypothetical protein